MSTKPCLGCNAEMDADAVFCNECGMAQPAEAAGVNYAPAPLPLPVIPIPHSEPRPEAAHPPLPRSINGDRNFPGILVEAVKKRYREGYAYANSVNGFGLLIQILGIIGGGVVAVAGFIVGGLVAAAAESARQSTFGYGPGGGVGVFIGFVIIVVGIGFAALMWVMGIIVRAAAQLMKANLDGAVNGSPFLQDADRAEMMSLPS